MVNLEPVHGQISLPDVDPPYGSKAGCSEHLRRDVNRRVASLVRSRSQTGRRRAVPGSEFHRGRPQFDLERAKGMAMLDREEMLEAERSAKLSDLVTATRKSMAETRDEIPA